MTLNSNRVHLNINEVVTEFFLYFLRTVIEAILKIFGSKMTFNADLTSTKALHILNIKEMKTSSVQVHHLHSSYVIESFSRKR